MLIFSILHLYFDSYSTSNLKSEFCKRYHDEVNPFDIIENQGIYFYIRSKFNNSKTFEVKRIKGNFGYYNHIVDESKIKEDRKELLDVLDDYLFHTSGFYDF